MFMLASVASGCAQNESDREAAQNDRAPLKTDQTVYRLMSTARIALNDGNADEALAAVDEITERFPDEPAGTLLAADIYLRFGKPEKAVPLWESFVERNPGAMAGLWQRGIALYFVGEYEKGVEQFEKHRVVNPNDVENAAWHFLCVAKSESFDKARELVLPAPNDPRIPMMEVQQMLKSGNTQAVIDRMNLVPADSERRGSAEFYGNFYLGLYADAQGDQEQALELMSKAAKNAPGHYMGDVARVYADYLSQRAGETQD